MANLGTPFDPDSAEPRDSLDPVPAGTYGVEVVESDVIDTKSGTGRMVKLTFKVMEGQCEGRQIWDNINFLNQSEQAQRIGQQALAELCAAVGHRGPLEDTEVLHGVPLKIRVKIEEDKSGNYGPQNRVQRYMPYDAAERPSSAPTAARQGQQRTAAQSAAPAQTANSSRPWGRKSA
jgi:hypothetical protein